MKEHSPTTPDISFAARRFSAAQPKTWRARTGHLSRFAAASRTPKGRATRLDLAKWLVSSENPLTPRVTMNRIWMRYFGRGLVETEEDFGSQGSAPTHPELLDWLAREFIKNKWSQKAMHRLIVTSATYQQSSNARPDLAEKDALNLLLARQNRHARRSRNCARCGTFGQWTFNRNHRRPQRAPTATGRRLCLHASRQKMDCQYRPRPLSPRALHACFTAARPTRF